MNPSRIVPAMKRASFLVVLSLVAAAPLAAQTTEFGVLFGGSKRVIRHVDAVPGESLINKNFSFSNSAVDVYYAVQVDPGTMFKLQVGRIDTPVAFAVPQPGGGNARRDVEGQVQHVEGIVEYRFSEPAGSTGLFAGVGMYRTTASG